jgi:ribosomal-protein-alanine N-acetyltransferase
MNIVQPASPPFFTGKTVYLRSLVEADLDGPYVGWFNDSEVCFGNSHHVFPYTRESALEYIHRAQETRNHLILAIVTKKDNSHVGNIALQNIHPVYRSAEFSILIGEKSVWGSGVGKEAGRLICDHGFKALNLHRIYCGTFENNTAMQHLALSLGMVQEGVRREAAFKNGSYLDIIEFGVLKSDYEQKWFPNERNK